MKYSGLTLNVILVNPGMFQSQLNLFPPLGSSSTFSWDCSLLLSLLTRYPSKLSYLSSCPETIFPPPNVLVRKKKLFSHTVLSPQLFRRRGRQRPHAHTHHCFGPKIYGQTGKQRNSVTRGGKSFFFSLFLNQSAEFDKRALFLSFSL